MGFLSKKECATCGGKIGLLTLNCELISGERVCDKCLEKMGLSMKQYTDTAFIEGFMVTDLEDIQLALGGDTDKLEYIRSLSSIQSADEELMQNNAKVSAKKGADSATTTSQATDKQHCLICSKKIGLFRAGTECDGGCVCDKCLESLGLSVNQYRDEAFIKGFALMTAKNVKKAFNGSEDKKAHIFSLSSEKTDEEEIDALIASAEEETAKEMEGIVYNFNGGAGDILLVFEDRIVIRRTGIGNALLMGLKGDKTIFFSDITSIQHKAAGSGFTAGYIQFSIPGGKEAQGGVWQAVHDENTITFKENTKEVEEMVKYLQDRLREVKSPKPQAATIVNQVSAADELLKFKNLLDAGVLTQEEFDKKKAELLNM